MNSIVESGDILSMSCKDGDEEVVDIDDGEDGHKICSKADVPIIGRSSDPEDDELSVNTCSNVERIIINDCVVKIPIN